MLCGEVARDEDRLPGGRLGIEHKLPGAPSVRPIFSRMTLIKNVRNATRISLSTTPYHSPQRPTTTCHKYLAANHSAVR